MELERFRQIVEAFGAISDRWPDDKRDAALALLARSKDAVLHLEQAQMLDRAMDQASAEAPSDALVERILESATIQLPPPNIVPGDKAAMGGLLRRWKNVTSRWVNAIGSDVDGIDWTMGSLARPAAALGCVALLGLVLGVSAPATLTLSNMFDEEQIVLMALTSPQVDFESFVFEGDDG